jgi:ubiquinone/menaquinone biosynthesis C-methylase UbiE
MYLLKIHKINVIIPFDTHSKREKEIDVMGTKGSVFQNWQSGSSFDFTLPYNSESGEEVARLLLLHRQLSELIGWIVPPLLDMSRLHTALDVGCGVGGWIFDMAWRHPRLGIIGIDDQAYCIGQAQALVEGSNATAVLQNLDYLDEEMFRANMFDLIHLRFLAAKRTPLTYPQLLRSLSPFCRKDGWIVWTEMDYPATNSAACEHLSALIQHALQTAGQAFSSGHSLGILQCMGHWLRAADFCVMHNEAHAIELSAGTQAHRSFVQQAWVIAQRVRPWVLSTGVTTEVAFDDVFSEMMREIRADRFCGIWYLRTVMGQKQA